MYAKNAPPCCKTLKQNKKTLTLQFNCCNAVFEDGDTLIVAGNPAWKFGAAGDELKCDDGSVVTGTCTSYSGTQCREISGSV